MVALFLNRPLDFSSFPTLLLLTTLLRLSLNVAVTRLILSHGNEGPLAAGHVVAAFGGFLMGGDVVIGLIVFSILLVVNFMVITKGSGRIAEVAARFSLDAMPGKQMAIDADLSAGLIDEKEARRRRRELEEESGFYGAMDGAAKFVRGDAIAALIITVINIVGGLAIGLLRHGMAFADAAATFTTLTAGDGLVSQIPALLVSTAAGIVVTKGGMEGTADAALIRQLGAVRSRWRWRPARRRCWRCCRACRCCRSWRSPGLAGGGAWMRYRHPPVAVVRRRRSPPVVDRAADQRRAADRHDPAGAGLRPAGAGGRRGAAADRADQGPAPLDRRRDGLRAAAGAHPGQHAARRRRTTRSASRRSRPAAASCARPCCWRWTPRAARRPVPGEPTREPAFGLPALWIDPALKEEAMFRGCTVVDPPSVLTTHLTEVVRENMAELLSYAETQKLLDELPREQQKLVADLIPSQITAGGVQRVLQSLLARARLDPRPADDPGGHSGGVRRRRRAPFRRSSRMCAHGWRGRSATATPAPGGYIPLVTLSAEWEMEFAEALAGPAEDRQLAMAPSKLQDFMQKLRTAFDAAAGAGEAPVLLTSGGIRSHVRAIVERIRPSTPVLAQAEIHPRAQHPDGGDDLMTGTGVDAMRLKLFRAPAMAQAMAQVRAELGEDALILATRRVGDGVEVTAALEPDDAPPPLPPRAPRPARLAALDFHGGARCAARRPAARRTRDRAGRRDARSRPCRWVRRRPLLLVGPPGAGKTLTVARLATRLVMAGVAPMVITADGKRAGATEQLAAFTRLLGISLIVACHPVTLGRALTRCAAQRAGAGRYAGLRSVRLRPDWRN